LLTLDAGPHDDCSKMALDILATATHGGGPDSNAKAVIGNRTPGLLKLIDDSHKNLETAEKVCIIIAHCVPDALRAGLKPSVPQDSSLAKEMPHFVRFALSWIQKSTSHSSRAHIPLSRTWLH
jgi:hypothetical protein